MARKKARTVRTRKARPLNEVCPFCKEGTVPSYKSSEQLQQFINDRGRIFSRARSGVCAKHQKRVAGEIKRARHLALLPFTVKTT